MAWNSTCLYSNSSLPEIPINSSDLSDVPSHSNYDSNGIALAQRISSALARLTFPNSAVESFLEEVIGKNAKTWDISTIVAFKPVTSTIIYLSVALALFLVLSLTFCFTTCCRCCKRSSTPVTGSRPQKRRCSGHCVCVLVLVLIGLIILAQMIYISIQWSRTSTDLDESIRTVNEEIYPKEISDYLKHLVAQFRQLDLYSTQNDSILIRGSQVIFFRAFQNIFQEVYFFNDTLRAAVDSASRLEELGRILNDSNASTAAQYLYRNITNANDKLISEVQKPVAELCSFANGSDGEINAMILEALEQVHQQLTKLIDTIEDDILQNVISEENGMLIKQDLEDQIRYYIRLAGILVLVLIILVGFIPLLFLSLICLCRSCKHQREYTTPKSRPSKCGICCARLLCVPVFVFVLIIVLLSGVLYGANLLTQATCRTVHENRSFLVSFLTDELFGTNTSDLILGQTDLKTTVNTIIEDCGTGVHFTTNLLQTPLSSLENNTAEAMNALNRQIFEQFNSSIDEINIESNIVGLEILKSILNTTNISNNIADIQNDLKYIQTRFQNITNRPPIIPVNLINTSTSAFRNYLNDVLQSTLDQCPLPLSTIYKADTLVCHDFAASISGLWLSLFIYLFLIVFGLGILGLCICHRAPSRSSPVLIVKAPRVPDYRF